MRQAFAEAHRLEFAGSTREGITRACEFERHRHVFERVHRRNEVKRLEHDTDLTAAEPGERILVESADLDAGNGDDAAVRPLQAGDHHQEGGFARSRRPDEADRLTVADFEGNIPEDVNAAGTMTEGQVDVRK